MYAEWLKEENLNLIRSWKTRGLTNEQIAKNIGVTTTTLYKWQGQFIEFADALKRGREHAVAELENAAFKAAIGYDVEEQRQYAVIGKDGLERTRQEKIKKHIPPNHTMLIFLMKNIGRHVWSNKPEHEETIRLQNEKLKAELELLKAQTDRLSGEASTPFDDLLADMLMHDDASEDESDEEDGE